MNRMHVHTVIMTENTVVNMPGQRWAIFHGILAIDSTNKKNEFPLVREVTPTTSYFVGGALTNFTQLAAHMLLRS